MPYGRVGLIWFAWINSLFSHCPLSPQVLWFNNTVQSNVAFYTSMMFDQVWPDFMAARLMITADVEKEFYTSTIVRLGTLGYLSQGTGRDVEAFVSVMHSFLPGQYRSALAPEEWRAAVLEQWPALVEVYASPLEAQREFLVEASKLPLFGARIFALDSISDKRVRGPCSLAISREGLAFLHPVTNAKLLSYSFNEVVSTRRLGSRASGKHYVDLKLGNLMVQRVTRCETRQGTEITAIISSYVAAFVEQSHQRNATIID